MNFVDTSFWLALQFSSDGNHQAAREIWQGKPGPLLTSTNVMGEAWTILRRRLGHKAAQSFRSTAERIPALTVLHVDDSTEDEAWDWLARHNERPYSFVDATSFALMRRRRIRQALAFDADFRAAGFLLAAP